MRALLALALLAPALAGCLAKTAPDASLPASGHPLVLPAEFQGAIPVDAERPMFWSGPPLAPTGQALDGGRANSTCEQWNNGPCPEFVLEVAPGGARLRVGLDWPAGWLGLDLLTPEGMLVNDYAYRDGGLSTEVFVDAPAPGKYIVQVRLWDLPEPANPPYALRAKLEAALPALPDPGTLLVPNLRADPPEHFTLRCPHGQVPNVESLVFLDSIPTTKCSGSGLTLPGSAGSCLSDEMAEDGARRCLRFDFGYQNTGLGPLDLHFSPLSDAAGTPAVSQRVHRAGGTSEDRPAGTYTYHETHMHYHYDDIFTAQLFRVADEASGRLEPAGVAAKRGACAHDIRMAEWTQFDQSPRGFEDSGEDCDSDFGDSPANGMRIGLSRGWGDIYTWHVSGNYVDFSDQSDGRYVLRVTVDQNARLLETDETDNDGYAYIEVRGDDVSLLERGWGRDPWDPARVVATWPRHPGAAPGSVEVG